LGIKKEISTIDYQDPNLTRTQINEKVNKNLGKLIVTTRTSKAPIRGSDSDDQSYYKKIMNHQPSFISESNIVPAMGKVALNDSSKKDSDINVGKNRDSILNSSIN
jgi:hypothetical protein